MPCTAAQAAACCLLGTTFGHASTLAIYPPRWCFTVTPEELGEGQQGWPWSLFFSLESPRLAADIIPPDTRLPELTGGKAAIPYKVFNRRGCQRPTLPAGLARGEVPQQVAGGGRAFGRWRVSGVLSSMLRCTAEGARGTGGGAHLPCGSA